MSEDGQLQAVLRSGVVIERAKGFLAEHTNLSMDQAFDLLCRYALAHNAGLAEVAGALIDRTVSVDAITAV